MCTSGNYREPVTDILQNQLHSLMLHADYDKCRRSCIYFFSPLSSLWWSTHVELLVFFGQVLYTLLILPNESSISCKCQNSHTWHYSVLPVLFFQDGKASSATVVGAFFSFLNLFESPEQSIHMFSMKRGPPGVIPSQKR